MYFTTSFHKAYTSYFWIVSKYNNGTLFQYSNTCMYYRCGAWWIHQFMRKILIWKFFEWMNVYTRFSFNDLEQKRELLKTRFFVLVFSPFPFFFPNKATILKWQKYLYIYEGKSYFHFSPYQAKTKNYFLAFRLSCKHCCIAFSRQQHT